MAAEYLEARVLLPEEKVAEFLAFCEEVLGCMPAINKIPPSANGHEIIEKIESHPPRKGREGASGA